MQPANLGFLLLLSSSRRLALSNIKSTTINQLPNWSTNSHRAAIGCSNNTNQLILTSYLSSSSREGASMLGTDTSANCVTASQVRLDLEGRRFVLDLGGPSNQIAWIDFKTIGRHKIDMYHSEVPKELRGRGVGAKLARGALEQAARNKLKVKLSCSYLISYLDRCDDPNASCVVEPS